MARAQASIIDGGAYSIMSAYNALNGIPCTANENLLETILREEWGFEGYVVSSHASQFTITHIFQGQWF